VVSDDPSSMQDTLPCTSCGTRTAQLAPSGRCFECEAGADVPTAPDSTSLLQIGAVATLVGLSLRTVRHYEDAGLVLPAARTQGGFRLYDDQAIERLRLIMKMKPLGFTLEEMRLLIEARQELAAPNLDPQRRWELQERLAMFATAAAEKVAHLQEQLAIAESFAETLEGEVERGS
jgi:MerR family transcriptional regulator, copper efflux regulator